MHLQEHKNARVKSYENSGLRKKSYLVENQPSIVESQGKCFIVTFHPLTVFIDSSCKSFSLPKNGQENWELQFMLTFFLISHT